jgi:hypothetical protein
LPNQLSRLPSWEPVQVISEGLVYEPVNECEARNSPPDTGGVAAPSRKRCEASLTAQTGWSGSTNCFRMRSLEEVPSLKGCALASACASRPSAPLKEASRLLLDVAATPPMSGGEWRTPFIAISRIGSWNRRGARAKRERDSEKPKGRAGWSGKSYVDSEATTPALRATPPMSGGEFSQCSAQE